MDTLAESRSRAQAIVLCISRSPSGAFVFDRNFKEAAKRLAFAIGVGPQWIVGTTRYESESSFTFGVVVSGELPRVVAFARKAVVFADQGIIYRRCDQSAWQRCGLNDSKPSNFDGVVASPAMSLRMLVELMSSAVSYRENLTVLAYGYAEFDQVTLVSDLGFFESWRRSLIG